MRFLLIGLIAFVGFAVETGQSQELPPAPAPAKSRPQNPPPPNAWASQTFELKFVDAEDIRQLFSGRANIIQVDEKLNLLTASGSSAFLAEVESIVKRFDVAPPIPRNVQMTFYLVTPVAQAPAGSKLPAELAGIEKQFTLPGGPNALRVADTQVLRARIGQSGEMVGLSPGIDAATTISQVRFRSAWVTGQDGKNVVSVEGLQVQLNVPGLPAKDGKAPSRISADLDLPEKQGVVLTRGGTDKPFVLLVRVEVTV